MQYLILSLISGVLLSLSWPTYGIPFFIFFALVPLLLAEHQLRLFSSTQYKGWKIFGLSYLTFLIWNAVTTGWLYHAQSPDGTPSMMAVLFPVLVNSLLYASVFSFYSFFKKMKGTYWGLAFLISIWMAFEKFHLEWEFTWPWLNLGNAFAEYPKLIQWYDTLGATGGSLWILIANVFLFYTIRIWQAERSRKELIKNASIYIGIMVIPMLISWYKYHHFDFQSKGEVSVLMLQPELDPYTEKYTKDSLQITEELLALAAENAKGQIDVFLAPETALPGYGSYSEKGIGNSVTLKSIQEFVRQHPKSVFIAGLSTHRVFPIDEAPANAYQYDQYAAESYNSAIQITQSGLSEIYHKGKLVPGVEIFPYMHLLKPILGDVMLNFGGTIASLGRDKERMVFANPYNKMKAAPIICYESIYGEFTTEYVKKGANLLAIVTNDSWWGMSEGHRQLLSYARLRAIETRREIVRSANSGMSAKINALGEVEEHTLYGDRTTLFSKAQLYEEHTFYTKTGDWISRVAIFVLGFIIFYTWIQWVRKKIKW